MEKFPSPNSPTLRYWPLFFLALSLEGLLILVALGNVPADPKNAILFGFSSRRLILLAAVFALTALFGGLAWITWRNPAWRRNWLDPDTHPRLIPWMSWGSLVLTILCWGIVLALPYVWGEDYTLKAFYERFYPLLVWFGWIGVQALAWATLLKAQALRLLAAASRDRLQGDLPLLKASLLSWGGMILLWIIIAVTRLGITPDPGGWYPPGVPLLEGQVWSILLAGLALVILTQSLRKPSTGRPRVDWLIAGVIWLGVAWLWAGQPFADLSHFAPRVRPPNFEIYPSSDAGDYDFAAQNILIGNGFINGKVVTRPLYILFLAGLRAVAGQDYEQTVALQGIILALFPAFLYLLGRNLHSRLAGFLAAALAVWREINSIQTIPFVTVSNSKLFMTDLPTALAVTLLCLVVVHWLKDSPRNPFYALITGGGIGLAMLLRTQTAALMPFVLVLALLSDLRSWKRWLLNSLLIGAGILLAIGPWLARNYANTGMLLLEQPSQSGYMAQMYSLDPLTRPEVLPGEDEATFARRVNKGITDFALNHPLEVLHFSAAHFINNELSSLLVLPLRPQPIQTLDELFQVKDAFWWRWDGNLGSWLNGLSLFLNLGMITLGAVACWKRARWAGLVPLVFHLAYNLSSAVTRNSGNRFVLPVDWVIYFYFTAGVVQLGWWILTGLGKEAGVAFFSPGKRVVSDTPPVWKILMAGTAILLVGAALPLSEILVPKAYPPVQSQALVEQVATLTKLSTSGISADALKSFLERPDSIILYGRVLYPRFYKANEGEPGKVRPPYEAQPYSHLGFLVIGPANANVVLPTSSPPQVFPHADEAIVIGCQGEKFIQAAAVVFSKGKKPIMVQADTRVLGACIITP